ncbi:helix-turn-helix transcriptional regulator [Asticcacaulis benevestitus]|uniref:helix-turn-helix transcriptional regulator n=1 Tax=Asticcacaulis benevestitus TaxID=347481 RepID=UPI000399CAC6|nr:helix-turn-helix domain-containing protein [Asticcacaulis benevestitus]
MTTSQEPAPPRYLRTSEAARFLGLSDRTLEKHRVFNTGPQYLKLGGRVVYSVKDLTDWAIQTRRRSTKDISEGRIIPTTRRTFPKMPGRST